MIHVYVCIYKYSVSNSMCVAVWSVEMMSDISVMIALNMFYVEMTAAAETRGMIAGAGEYL